MAHAGPSGFRPETPPSATADGKDSDRDIGETASVSSSLSSLSVGTAPDWTSVNFPPFAVVNNLPVSRRRELFTKLDQEVSCPGMAEHVYGAPLDSRKGERPSSSWIQQVRDKLSNVLHPGEQRFSRERSASPRRKGRSKSHPQKQICLRENLSGDLTVASASESEEATPLDLSAFSFSRLRKELYTLGKARDQPREDSPVRHRECGKRGRFERVIQGLPFQDAPATDPHDFSVSVPAGTTSRPPPYCDTQIPLIEGTIHDDDGFLYISRQGRTMPEMEALMKQAAQRGDDMTVSNLAREMDETFHEYQSGLSNVERKRRVDLTCRGSRSRAQARSGKGAINASPTDDRKSCSSGGESSERSAFQLTPQRSDSTEEQVVATASAASKSQHASYDTDGFFLVSVNGRSIADLQKLI